MSELTVYGEKQCPTCADLEHPGSGCWSTADEIKRLRLVEAAAREADSALQFAIDVLHKERDAYRQHSLWKGVDDRIKALSALRLALSGGEGK